MTAAMAQRLSDSWLSLAQAVVGERQTMALLKAQVFLARAQEIYVAVVDIDWPDPWTDASEAIAVVL